MDLLKVQKEKNQQIEKLVETHKNITNKLEKSVIEEQRKQAFRLKTTLMILMLIVWPFLMVILYIYRTDAIS